MLQAATPSAEATPLPAQAPAKHDPLFVHLKRLSLTRSFRLPCWPISSTFTRPFGAQQAMFCGNILPCLLALLALFAICLFPTEHCNCNLVSLQSHGPQNMLHPGDLPDTGEESTHTRPLS